MNSLESMDQWNEARQAPVAFLYKHSPICGLSHRALPHVQRLADARPEIPVYSVDVIHRRPISNRIEADTQVRHESPQIILLAHGAPCWHASHHAVTTEGMLDALEAHSDTPGQGDA